MRRRVGHTATAGLIALCASGAFLACLGAFSYLIRYGHLDSLEGQIPENIYVHVTSMFTIERALMLGGFGIFLLAVLLLVVAGITSGRRPD